MAGLQRQRACIETFGSKNAGKPHSHNALAKKCISGRELAKVAARRRLWETCYIATLPKQEMKHFTERPAGPAAHAPEQKQTAAVPLW
jgi:hypothetical protein